MPHWWRRSSIAPSRGDRFGHDDQFDDHPVKNDRNGSARMALISLERFGGCVAGHRRVDGRESAGFVADRMRIFQREVEEEFPNARSCRPGFDEPRR
jgi:hypothetical protein